MLKKLSKYGNSTTLVIDKAILELLNMDESSMVKLQTDGTSLIITPAHHQNNNEKVSYEAQEAITAAGQAINKINKQSLNGNLNTPGDIEKIMPTMIEDFKAVFDKNRKVMHMLTHTLMSNKEYKDAVEQLAQKVDPVTQPMEYMQELRTINSQFAPESAEFDREIAEVVKKYKPIK